MIRPWRETSRPPVLFPSATSVRLAGMMSRSFASRIIGDPSRLKHLTFDNLKMFGHKHPEPSEDLSLLEMIEQQDPDSTAIIGAEPANGIIRSLKGHCIALKFLRLTLLGAGMLEETWEEGIARYSVIADFLQSVRPTLQSLYFEQGTWDRWRPLSEERILHRGRLSSPYSYQGCPMDEIFARVILRALLEEPWPLLRRVEVRGAGEWTSVRMTLELEYRNALMKGDPILNLLGPLYEIENRGTYTWCGYTDDAMEAIRNRLGENIETLIIERDPSREYDHGYSTGIPNPYEPYWFEFERSHPCPRCHIVHNNADNLSK